MCGGVCVEGYVGVCVCGRVCRCVCAYVRALLHVRATLSVWKAKYLLSEYNYRNKFIYFNAFLLLYFCLASKKQFLVNKTKFLYIMLLL